MWTSAVYWARIHKFAKSKWRTRLSCKLVTNRSILWGEDPSHFVKSRQSQSDSLRNAASLSKIFMKCRITKQDLHEMLRFTIRLWHIHNLASYCAYTWKVFSLSLIVAISTRTKRRIRDRHQRHVEVLRTVLKSEIKGHRSSSQGIPETARKIR